MKKLNKMSEGFISVESMWVCECWTVGCNCGIGLNRDATFDVYDRNNGRVTHQADYDRPN